MSAKIILSLRALYDALFGNGGKRSSEFEAFRFSFFEDKDTPREGLDLGKLGGLEGRERILAETLLIKALPDARAIIGLGVLASMRAQRRLSTIFERECAAAQAATIAGDMQWRGDALILTAQALWRIKPQPRFAQAIIGRLRHSTSWTERTDAAAALAEMPMAEVDHALSDALDDRHALVRHHAARALLTIHGVAVDARLTNHMVYRVMAAEGERRDSGRREIAAVQRDRPLAKDPPFRVRNGA